ncbi:MAG: DEAD/DEAH box helicase [Candidatus Aenigmarchaeota archaeon]|nr:DEAD/DEAH box helicase [Candidatus Aenigmarchaeota archaeon]MDW8149368.1 DEAD/DEAH box helicase [Candidatus Aenigmarchaeota archaeon]
MKIDEIKEKYKELEKVVEIIKREDKIENLFEAQEKAIKEGVLENCDNFIICTATGSGKTLIAELASLQTIIKQRKKVLYLAPLKALANEKYEEFKNKYEKIGIKFALSIGDYDEKDPYLKFFDMVFTTYEKADSLLRHKSEFFNELSLVVADEIHEIKSERGAILEILICLFKNYYNARIIGLSATIGNPKEMAEWLNAKLIISNFRPVELKEGIYFDNKIYFDKEVVEIKDLINKFLEDNGQILIFVNSRKNAEITAIKISEMLKNTFFNKEFLEDVLTALETPTRQCKLLAKCLQNCTAFHHAGLVYKQRKIIEDGFRKGKIKVIVATPTLIAGVNLPSRTVIINSLKIYVNGFSEWWPVSLYKQAVGRAGRIKYDKIGYAITIVRNKKDIDFVKENYINGLPEDVTSQLSYEPVLRSQVLSLIANEFCKSFDSLVEFFEKTFFFFQYKDKNKVIKILKKIVDKLEEWGFIKNFKATKVGKRVCKLYIDPLTAHIFIKNFEKMKKCMKEMSFLQLICSTTEMRPLIYLREKDYMELEKYREYIVEELFDIEEEFRSLKTALVLYYWINEKSEDEILESFNVTPGELFGRIEIAKWLLYSLSELSKIFKETKIANYSKILEIRMMKGVKEELIELVSLEGIGRIRARNLYNAGFKTLEDIKKARIEDLIKVKGIGIELANKIKNEIK